MEPLVLTIDCGTQSLRAELFDKAGTLRAIEKVSFGQPYFSKSAGWAEQDPAVYWGALCEAVTKLKKNHSEAFGRVIAVVVRHAARFHRAAGLRQEARAPMHTVARPARGRKTLKDHFSLMERASYALVGMSRTSEHVMRHSRTYWVQQHEPELWARTDKVVLLSCYLNYLLTGRLADAWASQIGHIPFEAKRCNWYKSPRTSNTASSAWKKAKCPSSCGPASKIGIISPEAARDTGIPEGLPVIAAASDKGCETLGNGCLSEDTASVSFGTTATVEITTPKYVEALRFIPPYPSAIPGFYNPEYEVFRGYWLISWFKREFAAREVEESEQDGYQRGGATKPRPCQRAARLRAG